MNEIVKLPIVYRMRKKNCTAESFVELPVTKEIYDSLKKELAGLGVDIDVNEGKIPRMIRAAMRAICKLQGYELSAIIVDIKTEDAIPSGKHRCKYCGGIAEGTHDDLLCGECRENFGHSLYSEL